ncbi:MAG: DegT/DnrJ/EryC1/StrS family aminotransferase [Thermoguttaceae bacterium]|jgi:8-amino-3,8-dideoxy-alpha-D-manno-octulosonate transaminase
MKRNDIEKISRRTFLAAVPIAASVPLLHGAAGAKGTEGARGTATALALNGAAPVRTTILSTSCPGSQFYDHHERDLADEAISTHGLFRWYGPEGQPQPAKVATFEKEFAKLLGVKYVLGITSGTAALHTALTALGVGPGDEVILPAWTWYSCYYTILMTGALPVFAEVDDSFAMDPRDFARKITPQTKAVMVVHLFGSPANMDAIMEVARRHNIKVLEDSAQCAGGQYKGKRTSTIGDMGIFSFQLHKMITAGEGGAVVTNDPLLYERAVRFHDLGLLRPPTQAQVGAGAMPYFMGVNYRMNEMTGAVMLAQVRKLDSIVAEQRRRGGYVIERVSRIPGIKMRRSNDWHGELHLTVDLLLSSQELRDHLLKAMQAENVPMERPSAAVILPAQPPIANKAVPHPAWPSFNSPRGKELRYGADSVPRSMEIFNRTATLTVGPKYTNRDLDDIVAAITKVYAALVD